MEKFQKLARITALAFSVVFELTAGPFVGYLAGSFLAQKFHMSSVVVSIGVFIGFGVSLYAAMLTIIQINKISQEPGKNQRRD